MANFPGLKPEDVDSLPLKVYVLGPSVKRLYDARQNGVEFTVAEPGWEDIPLNRSAQ